MKNNYADFYKDTNELKKIIEGYDLLRVLRLSNITGALSTRVLGTREAIPEISEVLSYE